MAERTKVRPFGRLRAMLYAVRAGLAHYRFARTDHATDPQVSGIGLVVSSRVPTEDEMNTVGSRWSDWSRMQGGQPVDPHVVWSDVTLLWAALHTARRAGNRSRAS